MSELEPQLLVNVLFGALYILGGWLLNSLQRTISDLKQQDKELAEKVQHMEIVVVGDYVKREDFLRLEQYLTKKLESIYSKLDGKADK